MEIKTNYVCDICNKNYKELAVFEKKGWIFTKEILICQSCVSKAFRAFRKNR